MNNNNSLPNVPPDDLAAFLAMAMLPNMDKPFGLTWDDDNIEKFLIGCDYILIERENEYTGLTYKVAVKEDDAAMPIDESNMYETFLYEMQNKIISLLLRKK